MKIICDCGAKSELIIGEDGESYTEDEGWSRFLEGQISIYKNYYQVFFQCESCGKELWIFT